MNTIKYKVLKVGRMYVKDIKLDPKHRFKNGLLHGASQADVIFTGRLAEAKRWRVSDGNANDKINDNNDWFEMHSYLGNMGFYLNPVAIKNKNE